jgi:hypothetical protein
MAKNGAIADHSTCWKIEISGKNKPMRLSSGERQGRRSDLEVF